MHSFADGHLGCFYVLTIVNSAGTNTEVHYTNIQKNSGNDCSQTTKKYWGKNRLHGKAKSYSDNLFKYSFKFYQKPINDNTPSFST